jgi:hypothetical protein
MSFKNLKILQGKPTKSIKMMPHLKLSKKYGFGTQILKKKLKIVTHMQL